MRGARAVAMNLGYAICGGIALGLLVYLIFALLRAEDL